MSIMSPQKPTDTTDDLPELPPLEDDGSLFGGDDDMLPDLEREGSDLDDAASDGDFGAFDGIDEQGGLLDGAEGSDDLKIDEEAELLAGAEVGLLDDSDEGDGRDVTEGEVGRLEGDEQSVEDGGAEGTDEDPSAVLEADLEAKSDSAADDDDAFDDDARFTDRVDRTRAPRELEREPWPRRSDVAWTVTRIEPRGWDEVDPVTSSGNMVVHVAKEDTTLPGSTLRMARGDLWVSTDGGATYLRAPSCSGVTAVTILSNEPAHRALVAALHDPSREASGIALVRFDDSGAMTSELIADWVAEDDDDGRVELLRARRREGARAHDHELLAQSSGEQGTSRLLRRKG